MTTTSDGERTAAVRALRLALAIVIGAGTAFVALHDWFGIGGSSLDYAAEAPVYDAVIVAAGLTCLLRSLSAGAERGAWIAIGAAILSWGAAEIYWTVAILDDPSPPYPSPADVGYLAFYPLAGLGLGLLVRARAHELDWRAWTDGLIAALGTAALGAAYVFDFVADQTDGTGAAGGDDAGLPARRHRPLLADRRRRRPHPLAPRPGLVAAPDRPGGDGRRRRRLHPAVDRPRRPGRRLDRPDLPDRRLLPRRPGLAAAHRRDQARGALRRLARADGPGALRRR